MAIIIPDNRIRKVGLKAREIEFIIDSLESSPHNLYKFMNYKEIIKKLKDAQDNKQNHSQESPRASSGEPNGVFNRKIHPDINSQGKKDGGSLSGVHLESRSKTGEDNLRESMPVDVDTHPDTNANKRVYADSTFQKCYEMGFDSKINGANKENSNYSLFSSPDRKKAWERGRRAARVRNK